MEQARQQHPQATASWAARRPAAVAGLFYPAGRETLAATLDALLAAARPPDPGLPPPQALIVPHAGYIYSGPVAATAYATLLPIARCIRRVLLLGPAHRHRHRGLALAPARRHATPLGEVEADLETAERLLRMPQVICSAAAHAREHSLEVQLPFLQQLLPKFRLLALTVGDACAEETAAVLDEFASSPEHLVLVSSDLSHYHDYDTARTMDGETAAAIVEGRADSIGARRACGWLGIRGLLCYARRRGLRGRLLDLRNSGDTAGDREQVVGYGAFAFHVT